MATAVYKGVPPSVSSSSFMEVAATMGDRRQGIGSILGFGSSSSPSSLRRTLSADMSSRTWRAQNQLLHSSSSSSLSNLSMKEEEEEGGGSMIGEEEEKEMGQSDVWNSILKKKKKKKEVDDPLLPAPYIHPLERRSSFGCLLSQKSLEICTESLGSETGTDCFTSSDEFDFDFFNSPPSSEAGDDEAAAHGEEEDESMTKLKRRRHQKKQQLMGSVNYHCSSMSKKSAPKSYPPPLPSISRRDGPCLHMRPHRVDGRLVVEAVPVPSQNYLHVQRENGRLVLSFIDIPTTFTGQQSSSSIHCDREVEAEVVGEENEEEEEEEIIEEHEHQQPDKSLVKMTKCGYADKDEEEDERGVPEEDEEEDEEEQKEEAMEEEEEEEDVEILVGVSVTTCRQPPQLQCSEKATDMVVQLSPTTTTTTNLVMTKILTRMPLSSHHPNKWITRTPTTTTSSKLDKKIASLVELEQESPTQQHHHLLGKEVKVVGPQKASAAAAAYMNPYDCWWRRGSAHSSQIAAAAVMAAAHPKGHQQLAQLSPPEKLILTNSKLNPEDLMRHIRRCNQNRRPFLIWEPYCIATSS